MKKDNMTDYCLELRRKIPDVAMPLFKKRGIKAVRMDEIASRLSISKRTLYEVYDNKEEVLLEGIKRDKAQLDKRLEAYARTADNEMDVLIEFLRHQMDDLRDVSPNYFVEITKYGSVMQFLAADSEHRKAEALEFTARGVEHGFFIPNLNYDIFNIISDAMLEYTMKTQLYERFSMKEIMHTFVTILLRGCCTEKGRQLLDEVL